MQVLNLQCKTCGKPCRSKTEKELHSKRTGHEDFEDKVNYLHTARSGKNILTSMCALKKANLQD